MNYIERSILSLIKVLYEEKTTDTNLIIIGIVIFFHMFSTLFLLLLLFIKYMNGKLITHELFMQKLLT